MFKCVIDASKRNEETSALDPYFTEKLQGFFYGELSLLSCNEFEVLTLNLLAKSLKGLLFWVDTFCILQ